MGSIPSHLPQDILDEVGGKRLAGRHHALKQVFNLIAKHTPGVYLQEKLLFHAVESYFIDLYRAKIFHNIVYADQHKRAAFTVNWIARLDAYKSVTDRTSTGNNCSLTNTMLCMLDLHS